MALPKAYLTSTKNLSAILNAIQTAKAPTKFTQRFLESLEFKSPNDRLFIGVLKALKFLSDDGTPTSRYFAFLDQTQAPRVLAEGIQDAYEDLFQINKNAQTLSKNDVMNKMKTLSQGQLSESVLDKMSLTFSELCKLADFSSPPAVGVNAGLKPATEEKAEAPEIKVERLATPARQSSDGKVKIDGLVYNIQIVLPESRDQAVYDALFRSLREHLG
jgi:Family of unknown function (DUF5343)